MPVYHNPAAHILTSGSANGQTGSAIDCRAAVWGFVVYYATANSAILNIQASHDLVGWLDVATVTASGNGSAYVQTTGFYPYVRGYASAIYSAAGGSAKANIHYTPMV